MVVELKGAPVAERVPLSQLRDAHGHVDLQRMGPRLALAALAREQRAAIVRLRRPPPACASAAACAPRSTAST